MILIQWFESLESFLEWPYVALQSILLQCGNCLVFQQQAHTLKQLMLEAVVNLKPCVRNGSKGPMFSSTLPPPPQQLPGGEQAGYKEERIKWPPQQPPWKRATWSQCRRGIPPFSTTNLLHSRHLGNLIFLLELLFLMLRRWQEDREGNPSLYSRCTKAGQGSVLLNRDHSTCSGILWYFERLYYLLY